MRITPGTGRRSTALLASSGGEVTFSNRLTLAYTELLCTRDNFLFRKGERVRGGTSSITARSRMQGGRRCSGTSSERA